MNLKTTENSTSIREQLSEIAEIVSNQLTPEKAGEILAGICKATDKNELEKCNTLDRLLWVIRSAYLAGYLEATETALLAQEAEEGATI